MFRFLLFILLAIIYLILPKSTHHFKLIRIRKYGYMIVLCLIMISLVLFSESTYKVAKNAFMLWVNNIIPSLLPFFICIDLLKHTPFIKIIGKILNPIMKPLFNVPGSGAFAIAMGITSGYPVGAKTSMELYENNECSKEEAERLLAFTNTSGPLFIISAVGIGMFNNSKIGLLLLLTHFVASLTVGILFRNYKASNHAGKIIPQKTDYGKLNTVKNPIKNKENSLSPDHSLKNIYINSSNLGLHMGNAIQNSIATLLLICGYIIFFAILGNILEELNIISFLGKIVLPILSFLNIPPEGANSIIKGFLEVTNGLNSLSTLVFENENIKIILSAFLLGIGGLSVLMQTSSIISKTDLSMKAYALGKILHGTIASIYTYLILEYTDFLNLDIVTAFSYNTASPAIIGETSNMITAIGTIVLIAVAVMFMRFISPKKFLK